MTSVHEGRFGLQLYKTILRLHRGLPSEMRLLGDEYVKEEFRRHKHVNREDPIVANFMQEWLCYAADLSRQLGVRGPKTGSKLGSQLSMDQLDSLRDDQLGQLHRLLEESSRTYTVPAKSAHNNSNNKNKDKS